jgi:hypothetical protein
MVRLRLSLALFVLCIPTISRAQLTQLPDAPQPSSALITVIDASPTPAEYSSSISVASVEDITGLSFYLDSPTSTLIAQSTQQDNHGDPRPKSSQLPVDAHGNPIPLNRQQPQRILGFMPNFRSVAGGAVPHAPGWKYNFKIATRQSFDYSSFIFLGLTTLSAEGINSHPALGKGADGFYAYLWRGFLDKTDGTYIGAWLLPSLLHEDTRYYAMGDSRSVPIRILYVMSRQVVARTYSGSQTPNIAGLGGKVLTQIISREYYPAGSTDFGVLATKFAYASMRDIAFTSVREFYPDIAAHYIRKHREKVAQQAARDAASATPAP